MLLLSPLLALLLFLGTAVLGQLPVNQSSLPVQSHQQPRIIGGSIIPASQAPYQAVLRVRTWFRITQCGAVLIAPQWLLTAEHCLHDDLGGLSEPIEVFLGFDQLPSNPWSSQRTGLRAIRHFRGPRVEIGNRTLLSDLLLLKLDQKVPTSANIRPIELPEVTTRWQVNQTAVVSGFGVSYYSDDKKRMLPSGSLQYTTLPILSKRDCLAMFRKKFPNDYEELRLKVAPETILCAGYEQGGPSSCFGDSGGPLAVCATPLTSGELTSGQQICKDNRWQLAGIVSFSFKCGEPNSPGLFANVALFTDWIRRVIRQNP